MPCEHRKDVAPANAQEGPTARIPKTVLVKSRIFARSKHLLTGLGGRLPNKMVNAVQAVSDYLRLGNWMRNQGIEFPRRVRSRQQVWDAVATRVANEEVLYLEFGVATGTSMRYWSQALKHPRSILHGFDSFEGLPEPGGFWTKGQFSVEGRVPAISDPRVKFFKGWFDQTLPVYTVPEHKLLLLNMDADLYSSTIYVLRHFRSYIREGTFIYFDELYPLEHELRALEEFLQESGIKLRGISADQRLTSAFFQCVGAPTQDSREL